MRRDTPAKFNQVVSRNGKNENNYSAPCETVIINGASKGLQIFSRHVAMPHSRRAENHKTLIPGPTRAQRNMKMRGEGGWTLMRRFHPGCHMMGYATPRRPFLNNLCSRQNSYDASPVGTGPKFRLPRFIKGKVYMKPSEALHPSSLATNSSIIQQVRHIFIQKNPARPLAAALQKSSNSHRGTLRYELEPCLTRDRTTAPDVAFYPSVRMRFLRYMS